MGALEQAGNSHNRRRPMCSIKKLMELGVLICRKVPDLRPFTDFLHTQELLCGNYVL